jgi:hypothetical protein
MVLAKEVMNTDGHVIFERRALFFERFGASGAEQIYILDRFGNSAASNTPEHRPRLGARRDYNVTQAHPAPPPPAF